MKLNRKILSIFVLFSLLLSSCDFFAEIFYKPTLIPVKISLDTSGQVGVKFDLDNLELATPIGTFGVELGLQAPILRGKKVLAVRVNGYDIVYDLHENEVQRIEFEPGYYSALTILMQDDDLIVELIQTSTFTQNPEWNASNAFSGVSTNEKPSSTSFRRHCSETAFTKNVYGTVVNPVRLRSKPYVPENLDENWLDSLQQGEKVYIISLECTEKNELWLYMRRLSGQEGWAREWSLSNNMVETTYIVPIN